MNDITGFAVQSHCKTTYKNNEKHVRSADLASSRRTEDDDFADILVRMWSLATGRVPRLHVRPSQLSEQELLWFWDDVVPASGRHARAPGSFPSGAAR